MMIRNLGKLYYRLNGYYPVAINDQNFKCDPYHLGFWRAVNRGGFEPNYFNILDTYLHPNSVYCDIGSWIGPTAIYASQKCQQVYCIEPDMLAYKFLLQNIELNNLQNVKPYNLAISLHNGTIKMASHGGNLGDSMTSMVNVDPEKESFKANCMKWESWLDKFQISAIDFLKMDIEGGEFELVPEIENYLKDQKPAFHLSTHCLYIPAEERKVRMEKLIETLKFYNRCYDESHQQVSFDTDIIKNCLDRFRSFLFLP